MRHHFPDLSIFSTQNLVSGLSKLLKHQFGALLLIIMKHRKTRPSHFSMPQNYEVVKVADLRWSKKRAKLVEWEARETYRGIRDVPVVVSSRAHQPKPRENASRRPRAEKNNSLQGEAAPQSMDIDKTFGAEEPVMPASKKRVRLTACQSCKSAPFEWRCSDCFPALVLCKECCQNSHQLLPFHRVQKWVGKYFMPLWLREVGVCLQFEHSEDPCPNDAVCHEAFHALNSI